MFKINNIKDTNSFITSNKYAMLVIFLLSLSLRTAYLFLLFSDPIMSSLRGHDSSVYMERAANIISGHWLETGAIFYSGIVYPYMLAFVGATVKTMIAIQLLVVDSLCSVLVYSLSRSIAGTFAGLISGILYSMSAVFIFAAGTLLFDPWVTFFVLLGISLIHSAVRKCSLAKWIGAGIAIGLASTAKPFLLLYFPLFVICWWLPVFHPSRRELFYSVFGLLLGIIVILSPISYRNFKVMGYLSPFPEGGGFAFYIGNNPTADGTLGLGAGIKNGSQYVSSVLDNASKRLGRQINASEASLFWFGEGIRFWLSDPKRALFLTGRKIAMMVNHIEIGDNYDFYLFREHFLLLRWLPDTAFIIPLGLLGVFISIRRWRDTGFILTMSGIYIVFLPLFWMSARFRYPLVALFTVFAGVAAIELSKDLRDKKFFSLVIMLISLVILAAICLWPITIAKSSAIQMQLASTYLSAGDQSSALRVVEAALKEDESAQLYLLRARIFYNQGHKKEALSSLWRSIALDHSLAEAHDMLEQISSEFDDPQEKFLRREMELNPKQPRAFLRLAMHYIQQKRYNAAIQNLEHALLLSPQENEVMFHLAVTYGLRGRISESLAIYKKLEIMEPNNATIAVNLGFAYFDDGQLDNSERSFLRATVLNSESSLARYGLGLVYKFKGDFDKSRQQFNFFLKTEPPQSYWASQARKNLNELGRY